MEDGTYTAVVTEATETPDGRVTPTEIVFVSHLAPCIMVRYVPGVPMVEGQPYLYLDFYLN